MSTTFTKYRIPRGEYQLERTRYYVEEAPVPEYRHASDQAVEDFLDIKYGIRIHWGVYALKHIEASLPIVQTFNDAQRHEYQQLYKQFNPTNFSADRWMEWFARVGLKMFAFTARHHDGFSMFDTKTKVKRRVNWGAPGGPQVEDCDLAYSIMDSPLRRDIVKELCDAARRRNIKINLYYSHPDYYDADFRNFFYHPIQTPAFIADRPLWGDEEGNIHIDPPAMIGPDPTPAEIDRMMARHRESLAEMLTNYGKIDMICFDSWLGPKVWPQLRQTLIHLRNIQPDAMFRNRGIGNYGDYYTPEDFVPTDKEPTTVPWFVIERLGLLFSYDPVAENYKNGAHIVRSLVDIVAKGGNFMVAIGPDENGDFHPTAVAALEEAGDWLKINGKAIYATRPREGSLWKEGDHVRFTRTKDRRFTYAICTSWPGDTLKLTTLKPRQGSKVRMLGVNEPLPWRADANGTEIDLPSRLADESARPCRHAWVFEIETGEGAA